MARRQSSLRPNFGQAALAQGLTSFSGARQIYAFGLLLLTVLFFMLAFRGRVPRAVERVFAPVPNVSEAKALERRKQVEATLDGAYYDAPDGATFSETPGYQRLLRMLTDHVRPGDVVANPPMLDRESALRAPDLQRSEQVAVRGVVAAHWAEKLDHPVFQLTDVWRVFLTDGDAEDGVVVDVLERPPALQERRDVVEVLGYFYRLVKYENRLGRRVEVPYLLARSLTILPEERHAVLALDDPAMLVVLLGIIAMVVWGLMRVVSSRPRRPKVRLRTPHIA